MSTKPTQSPTESVEPVDSSTSGALEGFSITLETPAAQSFSSSEGTSLFAEDNTLNVAAKTGIMEAVFDLMVQDETFEGFTRSLLLIGMRAIHSEAGTIFEVDHVNENFFFRASVGQSSDQVGGFTIPLGSGVVGYVADSRQPALVPDVTVNDKHLKSIDNSVTFKARNLIAAPIVIRGQIYGVIELLNRSGEKTYSQADVDLLQWFAGICAKAIEVRLMLAWALQSDARKNKAAA